MSTSVFFREGLFTASDGRATLLGSRCLECGHIDYPGRDHCAACLGTTERSVPLSREGELISATTVRMGNDRFEKDYVVGYVSLPEEVRVFAHIATSADGCPPPPGTRMTLEVLPLWKDGDTDVLAYRFSATGEEAR